jgi:hypothetical protein
MRALVITAVALSGCLQVFPDGDQTRTVLVDDTTWTCDVRTVTEDRIDDPVKDAADRCALTNGGNYDGDRCFVRQASRDDLDNDTRFTYSVTCLAASEDPHLASCLRGAFLLRQRLDALGVDYARCQDGCQAPQSGR